MDILVATEVAARGLDGSFAHWNVTENVHRNHILDLSLAPAAVELHIAAGAISLARAVLEQLDVVGVLCVEMFLDKRGRLLINELAPRPHNSGHWTQDACVTTQFEQFLRAVCGWPLGGTEQTAKVAMKNLIGQDIDQWQQLIQNPKAKLHLYGKKEARPGRKMGHVNFVG